MYSFYSVCLCVCVCECACAHMRALSHSVVSDSFWPHGLQSTRSSVLWIFQARILEWVAISSSRGSSWPKDLICASCVYCIGKQILYHWATWQVHSLYSIILYDSSICRFWYAWRLLEPVSSRYWMIAVLISNAFFFLISECDFLIAQSVTNLPAIQEICSVLQSGRSSGEGNGNPLQYSCLENSMDRRAWQATVYVVPRVRTWLSD